MQIHVNTEFTNFIIFVKYLSLEVWTLQQHFAYNMKNNHLCGLVIEV